MKRRLSWLWLAVLVVALSACKSNTSIAPVGVRALATSTPIYTSTLTITPSSTRTASPTRTPSLIPTNTLPPTSTFTRTVTSTPIWTGTPTDTPTPFGTVYTGPCNASFGEGISGSSSYGMSGGSPGTVYIQDITLSSAATLVALEAFASTNNAPAGGLRLALYKGSALWVEAPPVIPVGGVWNRVDVAPTLCTAGTYSVAFQLENSYSPSVYAEVLTGSNCYALYQTFGPFPANISSRSLLTEATFWVQADFCN